MNIKQQKKAKNLTQMFESNVISYEYQTNLVCIVIVEKFESNVISYEYQTWL